MKPALRFSKASGSTRRRVEKIIRLGDRATRRAVASWRRRQYQEGSSYAE
jgi:hypothetical protein